MARTAKPAVKSKAGPKGLGKTARAEVPHGSTHEDIYARLKHAIMSAHYVPGERLVVSKLEKVFGTSAMPIREALRRLVTEQALQNNPNRGVEVPQMSPGRLMELRRVRCEIEGKATEWAALTISKAELKRLEEIQADMNRLARSESAEGYLDLNLDFHFTIYRAARSPLLLPIIESLWMQVGPCLNTMRGEATLGLGMDHHEAMIAALRKGDGNAAREALRKDISEAADIILRLLPQ
ncbi:GntR family transcriptional regulator [Dongia sp.]|uniref:GntR family transcriptional regulator n=1 Tax=Dongia sp. TaxID=1977262 RepID=UPI0035B2BD60